MGKIHTIKIANSIKELNKDEWDALIGDNVYASYGWLKTVEGTFIGNIKTKYILVEDSGTLIGAAVCYLSARPVNFDVDMDDFMFGKLTKYTSRLGISFMPAFICCPMKCHGKHFLIANGTNNDKKKIIMDRLLDTIEKEAAELKLSVSFTNVLDDETELIQLLAKRGYHKMTGLPLNYMDIEWSSFEGYKKYIRSISINMNKCIKKEINKNRREGVVIETLEELDGYEDRLHELVNMNYYKYNRTQCPFKKEFFKKLKENMGKDVAIYVSIKKGKLTGVSLSLTRNKVGYFLFIGVDHEMTGNDATYFNIGFYRPIKDAISDKTKKVYNGLAMYQLKARRGYKVSNTYVFYKSFNKIKHFIVKPWFDFHSFWIRRNYHKW